MIEPIVAAALVWREGVPFSERYGDPYWSRDGGLEEARHVFLAGNALPGRWRATAHFTVLETGFGSGLNFLGTWQCFRETAPAGARLHYLSVDKHPFEAADLARLHAHWPQFAPLSAELLARYPALYPGFHRLHLDHGRITLTLLFGDALERLGELDARVDAFFLDGFAPARNPRMWSEALFRELGRLAAPGASLATYSAAGKVSRAMTAAGFVARKVPGFGRKREMLVARRVARADEPRRAPPASPHALVIGAGIAGCLVSERLAARGWQIDLIERHEGLAREASGNPAAVLQPVPALDGNRLSRLSMAGFHYALRRLQDAAADPGLVWQPCGVLRLARNERQIERQQQIAEAGLFPESVLRWVDRAEAAARAGWPLPAPGWWFAQGGWVNPPSWCDALLRASGAAVRLHARREVVALLPGADGWRALDAAGEVIAQAPLAIIAGGQRARLLRVCAALPLRPVRGQLTCIPVDAGRPLPVVVAREGYVTPATRAGVHVVGATYAREDCDEITRPADHLANLERLRRLVPGFAATVRAEQIGGRAGIRCVGPDRLPLVGAIPGNAGLFGLLGLGSRGLSYGPLCAELLACRITGEPLPVDRALADDLLPAARMEN